MTTHVHDWRPTPEHRHGLAVFACTCDLLRVPCPTCRGFGRLPDCRPTGRDQDCPECWGDKYLVERQIAAGAVA